MATARRSDTSRVGIESAFAVPSSVGSFRSPAVESAVDSYATRLLRDLSPPEACIDDSLGPYVTSTLRCSVSTNECPLESFPDYVALVELLGDHCGLDAEEAHAALEKIVAAVRTGTMDIPQTSSVKSGGNSSLRGSLGILGMALSAESLDRGAPSFTSGSLQGLPVNVLKVDPISAIKGAGAIDFQGEGQRFNSGPQLDRLIPVGLLGEINDPPIPLELSERQEEQIKNEDDPFPPLGSATFASKGVKANFPGGQSEFPIRGSEVAYPYSGSVEVLGSPQPSTGDSDYFFSQQLEATLDMLLSINPDLGEDAARMAATLGGADIDVAQFIIDGALAAPAVCRHMLNDGCYRSDCQFSHDVEGHTCLFWLRGRCGKGKSCRFLHGFSEKLLDGVNPEFVCPPVWDVQSIPVGTDAWSRKGPIATQNLVKHNVAVSTQQQGFVQLGGGSDASFALQFANASPFSNQFCHSAASWEHALQASNAVVTEEKTNTPFSFASVASNGYGSSSFVQSQGPANSQQAKPKWVRIPQDLWNPHINRNSGAFHITHPLERYKEVNKSVSRDDVIDLHFQSTKTFPVVLQSVLPERLRDRNEVWIVTGSGHHVGRDTHQKGGGALERAVLSWLESQGYVAIRGRDRNGFGGAILVRQ